MQKKAKLFVAALLGLSLAAPLAFADEWGDANQDLRKAQEEYNKDSRQMNEARAQRDRQGVVNEQRELVEDRQRIANAQARIDGLRRSGSYGGYGRGWNDRRGSNDRYEHRGEWRDAREDLRRAEAELAKDHGQYLDARRHGDRHGMQLEAREMQKDRQEIARQRARLNSLQSRRGW